MRRKGRGLDRVLAAARADFRDAKERLFRALPGSREEVGAELDRTYALQHLVHLQAQHRAANPEPRFVHRDPFDDSVVRSAAA